MPGVRYPTLFQINTRVWLQRLSREAGRQLTLADIDDAILDGFVENGFDWIWLAERLANRRCRSRRVVQQSGMAQRVRNSSAGPYRGRYLRFRICDHGL